MLNKLKWIIGLPAAVLLAVILIGGYVRSRAASTTDFNIIGSELIRYNGSDAQVRIPNGVEVIGREAFASNPYLEVITIPDSVTTISYGAFADCSMLRRVILPDSVVTIEDSAFNNCSNLQSVTVGSGLSSLGSGVFAGCQRLANVYISANNPNFVCNNGVLYDAGQKTLYQYLCGNSRYQYRMPDTVENIKRYAFWGCDKLENIILSTSLKEIPEYALANATGLETVTINAPLSSIGLKAFEGCGSLKQITFPISVTQIHDTAFDFCNSDILFVCNEGSYVDNYASEHGFTTDATARYQITYFEENDPNRTNVHSGTYEKGQTVSNNTVNNTNNNNNNNTSNNNTDNNNDNNNSNNNYNNNSIDYDYSYNYPDGILLGDARIVSDRVYVMVGNMAVTDGSVLNQPGTNVTLSAINDYAYYNRPDLTSYTFPADETVEVIGKLAFARTGLSDIVLPEGLLTISYGAFYHCDNLTNITIPATVTNVEAYAFEYTPWLENWRNSTGNSDYLIVGDGVLAAYKGNSANIVIPDEVKYIASGVFRGHNELISVTFPSGLLSIGSYAFSDCNSLTDLVNLSESVYRDPTAFN